MAKQFNVPFEESEVEFLEEFKNVIDQKGYKSQKEWLKAMRLKPHQFARIIISIIIVIDIENAII